MTQQQLELVRKHVLELPLGNSPQDANTKALVCALVYVGDAIVFAVTKGRKL